MKPIRLWWLSLLVAPGLACTSDSGSPAASGVASGLPREIDSVIFLQRVARNDGMGNVFDYTGYEPGGRIVKLSPPAPDGKLTVLTSDPMFAEADFMAWDLSFDARTIVFSARLKGSKGYHLYALNVDGTNPRQITDGPDNDVYPIFVPGQKILYMTSKSVEDGARQFQDEYERQTTAQVAVVNIDGSGEALGPRNVSHRVAPALMPNGRVLYTEWRHLGEVNDGHLRFMNADMTGMREAFGGEGRGVTNSYLKGRYVDTLRGASGVDTYRIVTVATSRDRTLQSGKLLLVDLNETEAKATVKDLTPLVPGDREPSALGVGRYYDAEPVGAPADLKFLVSWADGPVQNEVLERAKSEANFGLYVLDGKTGTRRPLWDDAGMWDVMARPVKPRPEPAVAPSPQSVVAGSDKSFVIGALNVYESSVFKDLQPGTAFKVRVMEGFSSEEGFPNMFGLTEFDGQSRLGEVDVRSDGSFAAKVPANVPIHLQIVDRFGMAMASEDIWFSGRPGEQRFCGGCHEDRGKNSVLAPGSTMAVQLGATDLDRGIVRKERLSTDFSYDKIRGVPWDTAIQPIFDKKCVSCHDGDPNKLQNGKIVNPSFTVVDRTLGTMQTFVFDLRSQKVSFMIGERRMYDYPASYVSLMGVDETFGENQIQITNVRRNTPVMNGQQMSTGYVTPGEAHKSEVIRRLNPPQRFPVADPNVRAWKTMSHPKEVGGQELDADEHYRLILNIDMGGQYYFRENKRAGTDPTYVRP